MKNKRLNQLLAFHQENPEDSFILFALAKEYEKNEDYDKALLHYTLLVEKDVNYVGTYYHYGKLKEALGHLEEALEIYQKGMSIAKNSGDQHALGELAGAKLNVEDLLEE